MKTHRDLFSRLYSLDHLEEAARLTVRGKRRKPDVAWFLFRQDSELARLSDRLWTGRYCPAPVELVTIRDPKPRVISRVPILERVLHTALVKLLEPAFAGSFPPEAYACRKGFGTHRALLRLLRAMRKHPYALHLDIRSYFPSIDPEILLLLLRNRVRDRPFIDVIERVLDSTRGLYDDAQVRRSAQLSADWPPLGRGLPIGSHLSQFLAAHVYLNALDHFVKRQLKVPEYLRYVDDLFLFGKSRASLRAWRRDVAEWVWKERSLLLKRPKAPVLSCRGTLDGLGYCISRSGFRPRPRAFKRLKKRIVQEMTTVQGASNLERSLAAHAGVLLF